MKKRLGLRKADIVLAATVLAVAALTVPLLLFFSGHGTAVEVRVDGELIATLPLSRDTVLDIPTDGGLNRLVIAGGKASVEEADCPDKICVRHRPVSRPGESILCLPHKVAVTVVGGEPELDGVV